MEIITTPTGTATQSGFVAPTHGVVRVMAGLRPQASALLVPTARDRAVDAFGASRAAGTFRGHRTWGPPIT